MAHATEFDTMMEAENKTARRRRDVRVVEDPLHKVRNLTGELVKTPANSYRSLATSSENRGKGRNDGRSVL